MGAPRGRPRYRLMLIRTLFFLLLTANIGYYAWQVMNPPPVEAALPSSDPGVTELELLKEREQALMDNTNTSRVITAYGDTNCFALGPFSNQADLRRAFNTLAPFIDRSRQRQSVQTQDRGFWVYLPAVETREAALAVARDLATAGLKDYYVVTAGDEENTISLGLFREQANAQRRQTALKALGFDARITRRTEESLLYWLDYSRRPDTEPPWERVVVTNPRVTHRPINCFR